MIRLKRRYPIIDSDLELLSRIGLDYKANRDGGLSFFFLRNKDRTIRWLFPAKSEYPSFLNFYNTGTLTSELYSLGIRLIFALGLGSSFFVEKISLVIRKNSLLSHIMETYGGYSYSLFTGTAGVNRKVIIELNMNGNTIAFAKLPITDTSLNLVRNERYVLNLLSKFHLGLNEVPKVVNKEPDYLIASNIKPRFSSTVLDIRESHLGFLSLLYAQSRRNRVLDELVPFTEIKSNMAKAANILTRFGSSEFFQKAAVLHEKIFQANKHWNLTESIVVGLSHGDFTPWNMYISKDRIHVFDWELAVTEMPLLYDVFHFTFQVGVLIQKKSFLEIFRDVSKIMRTPDIRNLVHEFNVDWRFSYKFYLIHVSSYYCLKYLEQENIHEQAYWLVDTWIEALDHLIESSELILNKDDNNI